MAETTTEIQKRIVQLELKIAQLQAKKDSLDSQGRWYEDWYSTGDKVTEEEQIECLTLVAREEDNGIRSVLDLLIRMGEEGAELSTHYIHYGRDKDHKRLIGEVLVSMDLATERDGRFYIRENIPALMERLGTR